MARTSTPVRILAVFVALILFALASGTALAVADDFIVRETMPTGAAIDGHDLTGLTRQQARALVAEQVAGPLSEPVTVIYGKTTFPLDAASLVKVDVEGMVSDAFQPKSAASLLERVRARALTDATGAVIDPRITVDEAALQAWIKGVASTIDKAPIDAAMKQQGTTLEVVASRKGEKVDQTATLAALTTALRDGSKEVTLAVTLTKPKVAEKDLGPTILVRRTQRKLWLYDHGKLVKTYPVAVGTPGYPTPRGEWEIVQKRYRPTWANPGSDWAKDMPATIGPGPGNPLGTRAMNLNVSGIRIHGTSKDYSIGTAASHGCMRMHMWDVEDLYDRVVVGTPVFIID